VAAEIDMLDIIQRDAANLAHIEGETARLDHFHGNVQASAKTHNCTHIGGNIRLI
jgi:hypothetical protein